MGKVLFFVTVVSSSMQSKQQESERSIEILRRHSVLDVKFRAYFAIGLLNR